MLNGQLKIIDQEISKGLQALVKAYWRMHVLAMSEAAACCLLVPLTVNKIPFSGFHKLQSGRLEIVD